MFYCFPSVLVLTEGHRLWSLQLSAVWIIIILGGLWLLILALRIPSITPRERVGVGRKQALYVKGLAAELDHIIKHCMVLWYSSEQICMPQYYNSQRKNKFMTLSYTGKINTCTHMSPSLIKNTKSIYLVFFDKASKHKCSVVKVSRVKQKQTQYLSYWIK